MRRTRNTHRRSAEAGFTLVELLIVVIILGILAAIVVPQFASSTEDAKLQTLRTDLTELRSAVELYYHQHNNRYPGKYKETDGTSVANASEAATAFAAQLTQYTDKNGKVSGTKDATYKYGPYLKALKIPVNPFMDGATADDMLADIATTDITAAPTANGTTGWKFYVGTGRVVANDNLTLSDGTTKTLDM
jgi:general secretion pathway protein G